jgi:hypothetical protein
MLLWCVALFGAIALVGCSDSDDTSTPGPGDQPYDGPVVEGTTMSLSTFSPNYGKYLQKVVFEGKGFTSPENMKVYFNQRPSAVIGVSADGTKFYALAPRLPGDDCVISVVQGSDSLVYNEHFAYTASTTVETLVGTGKAGQTMGSFAEAEISPYYAVADKSGNLFVASRNQTAVGGAADNHSFIRVDMVNSEVSMLSNGCVPNVPTCDLETGVVSVPTEAYTGSFIEFNPIEMWAPRFRQFTWDPNNTDVPRMPWKHCMVVNPSDGMIYTRYYYGHIARINPETLEAELVCKTGQFDTYGMCFRPDEPNVLYFTGYQYHRIYKLDMNLPKEQWEAIQINGGTGVAGHQDGALSEALFNSPSQMCCDAEGNIYVADERNHCIRRINADNTVETVLGIPGKAGYQDGDVETALLKRPRGVTIDQNNNLYIADFGNAKIRKMKID